MRILNFYALGFFLLAGLLVNYGALRLLYWALPKYLAWRRRVTEVPQRTLNTAKLDEIRDFEPASTLPETQPYKVDAPKMKGFRDFHPNPIDDATDVPGVHLVQAHTMMLSMSDLADEVRCGKCLHVKQCLPIGLDDAPICHSCATQGTEAEIEMYRENFSNFMDMAIMAAIEAHMEEHYAHEQTPPEPDPRRAKAQFN